MRRRGLVPAAAVVVLTVAAVAAQAGRGAAGAYGFRTLVAGFTAPVYVTSAPDDRATLYVVEQGGTVRIVRDGRIAGTFLDLSAQVLFDGERGLLSIAFHPDYARNHLLYADYTDLNGDTRIVELRAENGVAVPTSARELLFVDQPYPNHKGGQLAFDAQGRLYVGMGDGGTNPANGPRGIGDPENRAQSAASMLGKLLRIDPTAAGASWQVLAYGLRNPWRFSFDRGTGDLWLGDVGAAKWEEVDYRPQAQLGTLANFGWSHFEGRSTYNKRIALAPADKLVFPAWAYPHLYPSGRPPDCGVIGGYVYRGARVPSARGRYFFGDLCSGKVWTFRVGKGGRVSRVSLLPHRVPNLSSFGEDVNGELYAVSLDGAVYALRP